MKSLDPGNLTYPYLLKPHQFKPHGSPPRHTQQKKRPIYLLSRVKVTLPSTYLRGPLWPATVRPWTFQANSQLNHSLPLPSSSKFKKKKYSIPIIQPCEVPARKVCDESVTGFPSWNRLRKIPSIKGWERKCDSSYSCHSIVFADRCQFCTDSCTPTV